MKDSTLEIGGDRHLAYTDIGRVEGPCVFFFHGAPTSRLRIVFLDAPFSTVGVRVVSPDRPGYGGSSPHPGRTMADWATDVAALADGLGVERFVVAGHSSGGPYAVACAALLGDRVAAGAAVAGVTDMRWSGAWDGYLTGRTEPEVMRLSDEAAAVARCVERFGSDGAGFLAEPFELPEPDAVLFADAVMADVSARARAEALRQGIQGYAQDVFLEGQGWPFDPSRISVPFQVVHGESDTLLPLAHSRHTADRIPGATFDVLPGHGHFTILSELPRIVSELWRSVR